MLSVNINVQHAHGWLNAGCPPAQVIAVVKNLTKTGITICATIHNPTPFCFNLFDRLMILLHGRVVYSGENGKLPVLCIISHGLCAPACHPCQPDPVCLRSCQLLLGTSGYYYFVHL